MGNRGTDLEKFLMQYPYLLRWVTKLRRLAKELALDEDGLCQQCRQAHVYLMIRRARASWVK